MQKGMFGRQNQYRFTVNSNDHMPPHFHVAVNNDQVAKYDLLTGKPISSNNSKLDKFVSEWFGAGDNMQLARNEWERSHGTINQGV